MNKQKILTHLKVFLEIMETGYKDLQGNYAKKLVYKKYMKSLKKDIKELENV